MSGWGLAEHADVAELIVSELATNALRHGTGLIEIRLFYAGGDLRIEVHDDGAGRPSRQLASDNDECGRGLELLDGLTELHGGELGVIEDGAGPGKTVYVSVHIGPPRHANQP
jgi:signal transduction histidine kinase